MELMSYACTGPVQRSAFPAAPKGVVHLHGYTCDSPASINQTYLLFNRKLVYIARSEGQSLSRKSGRPPDLLISKPSRTTQARGRPTRLLVASKRGFEPRKPIDIAYLSSERPSERRRVMRGAKSIPDGIKLVLARRRR